MLSRFGVSIFERDLSRGMEEGRPKAAGADLILHAVGTYLYTYTP